jgi:1-acyl-sn-glycerol-3-phosphate acyltransferase
MTRRLRRGAIFARAIHKSFREFARRNKKSGRSPTLPERADWLTHACRGVLASLEVQVSVDGAMPESGLIVSNHLSYIDILCYSSIAPCIFVSKSEVRGWPVFGRLATNGGTIYIDRKSKLDARRVATEMETALRAGIRVVLFPEGTSSGGDDVMPFHAPLLESAVKAKASITPASVAYEIKGGDPRKDVCYWGEMTFATHFLGLLGKGKIHAHIKIGNTRHELADRKSAARLLHEDVTKLHARLSVELKPGRGAAANETHLSSRVHQR